MHRIILIIAVLFMSNIGLSQYIDTSLLRGSAIKNLGVVNNKHSQFSPTIIEDGLLYVEYKQRRKSKDLTRHERAFDLMQVAFSPDFVGEPEVFEAFRSEYVEGPASFNRDYTKLYLTRSNMNKEGVKKSSDKQIRMKIFESIFEDNSWTEPKLISFLLGDFNYCHPSIDSSSEFMIFASDLPGGYGKMDLYLVRRQGDGWSSPTNLGPTVNTEGNDWFPSYHDSGLLFYASDGKTEGKTDLDIYVIDISQSQLGESQKLPSPVNSEYDDFSFVLKNDQSQAFFSSSRISGKGGDDLYQILFSGDLIVKTQRDSVLVQFHIQDELNSLGLSESEIRITNLGFAGQKLNPESYPLDLIQKEDGTPQVVLKLEDSENQIAFLTNDEGKLNYFFREKERLLIEVLKEGYQKSAFIYTPMEGDQRIVKLTKTKEEPKEIFTKPEIFIPTTKGSIVVFENIYYDLNSSVIKLGAAKELDALLSVMNNNPEMRVQLSAHTDSRGNDVYNQILSDQRAQSAKNYLTQRGINPSRIIALGFGESRLRNHCKDGVDCTEDEHRFNRRTEVKVVSN